MHALRYVLPAALLLGSALIGSAHAQTAPAQNAQSEREGEIRYQCESVARGILESETADGKNPTLEQMASLYRERVQKELKNYTPACVQYCREVIEGPKK